jgi:hypothetical protein
LWTVWIFEFLVKGALKIKSNIDFFFDNLWKSEVPISKR